MKEPETAYQTAPDICPSCGGTGVTLKPKDPNPKFAAVRTNLAKVACSVCEGSGKTPAEIRAALSV